jgi:hypothetical protein
MEGGSLANQPSHADKIRAGLSKWRGTPPGLPRVTAAEFMAALGAGKTIGQLTGLCTDPDFFCSYARFKKHCELNPEWGAEAWRISNKNVSALKSNVAKRSRTHCSRGHAFALSEKAFKRHVNGKQYRYCRICNTQNALKGGKIAVDVVEQIKTLVRAGNSVSSFTGGGKPGYLARFYSVKQLRAQDPELDHLVRVNCVRRIRSVRIGNLREPTLTGRIAAQPHEIFTAVDGAVSRRLPHHIRDEVMGRLSLDILELRVDISAVAHFARLYTKQAYNEMEYPKERSLDARFSAHSSMTLLDRISAEAGSEWWDIGMAISSGRQIR